jgi:hypothetical protein
MNEIRNPILAGNKETQPENRRERRAEPRVKVDRLVYVQTASADAGHFEEVRSMRDLSRSGFYFTTGRNLYRPGLQLHVVPAFGNLTLEYRGEVVRVEELPGGEFGVAVRLLRVESLETSARSKTLSEFHAFARAEDSSSVPVEGEAKPSSRS